MERIFQALETVGPLGVFVCLIVGAFVALLIVLNKR